MKLQKHIAQAQQSTDQPSSSSVQLDNQLTGQLMQYMDACLENKMQGRLTDQNTS